MCCDWCCFSYRICSLYKLTKIDAPTPPVENKINSVVILEPEQVAVIEPTTQPRASQTATGGNCEQYRSLIEQYSDWDSSIMLAIMRGESNCNPNSINWGEGHQGCQGSVSLLLVACLHY